MRRQSHAAEDYVIPVMQNSVYTSRRERFYPFGSECKVLSSSGADYLGISVHNHITRLSLAKHLGSASHVVRVGLTIEENLYVFPRKAEFLNAFADQRWRTYKIRVDQDVSRGSCN